MRLKAFSDNKKAHNNNLCTLLWIQQTKFMNNGEVNWFILDTTNQIYEQKRNKLV